MTNGDEAAVTLVVGDRALAAVACAATLRTPGVVRLQAAPRQAALHAARRLAARGARPGARPADIDRGRAFAPAGEPERVDVTVRVTVDLDRPVREVVDAVQRAVATALEQQAGVQAIVAVHVLDGH